MRLTAVSSLYETAPVGVADQPAFLNLAVTGESELEPEELLIAIKHIESEVGRRPTFRWGPRVLDIDILLYDDRQLETETLVIPHPEMTQRAFVLIPLAEIAGEVIHPTTGRSISALRDQLPDKDDVRLLGPAEFPDPP